MAVKKCSTFILTKIFWKVFARSVFIYFWPQAVQGASWLCSRYVSDVSESENTQTCSYVHMCVRVCICGARSCCVWANHTSHRLWNPQQEWGEIEGVGGSRFIHDSTLIHIFQHTMRTGDGSDSEHAWIPFQSKIDIWRICNSYRGMLSI